MKKCPFCAEEIQDEAIKCEHCGKFLVGGWLLILSIGLTIVFPLGSIMSLNVLYNAYVKLSPYFSWLLFFLVIDLIFTLGFIAFSIYAGLNLLKIKKNAVKIAKSFLLTVLLYFILEYIMILLIGFPSNVYKELVSESINKITSALVAVGIWYSYLNKSERVKNTYGPV